MGGGGAALLVVCLFVCLGLGFGLRLFRVGVYEGGRRKRVGTGFFG